MAELFHSGVIIELILAAVVVEALLLSALRRIRGRGPPIVDWLPNLLSGASLLLALRLTIAQSAWYWVAALLALSLVTHLADLARRFQV